ncbi:hypothetical protein SAICODRAFT_31671 [Saitoella complicata NRRL Y-17804]|uniref:C2H2-type domain-containing protein n=1 Tax=Saitoella complicata (strain BCRC 22490 / CBS 7301 / JCM 7358 / NBRC 10748 / NRRL Y-17804) TaxID=698492 RepID=A0A0E9NEY3_SAICN|nr:uncharacterized protein SAICODRAFT_31671 [Saitoella complicata NRRL Y-17804]ODQ50913.1 hypothetical protein SAICODRAFT_31671 [Saitoella complicata NRRL Y-17804]GAO48412.1 hypothetical protein G7K_2585-t1 [Saitoella complicata NRRL Y-17804]
MDDVDTHSRSPSPAFDDDEILPGPPSRPTRREILEHKDLLKSLDHTDAHNISLHALSSHNLRKRLRPSSTDPDVYQEIETEDGRIVKKKMRLNRVWTAWPMPAHLVPRPRGEGRWGIHPSAPLRDEIHAAFHRISNAALHSAGLEPSAADIPDHPAHTAIHALEPAILGRIDDLLQAVAKMRARQGGKADGDRLSKVCAGQLLSIAESISKSWDPDAVQRARARMESLLGADEVWNPPRREHTTPPVPDQEQEQLTMPPTLPLPSFLDDPSRSHWSHLSHIRGRKTPTLTKPPRAWQPPKPATATAAAKRAAAAAAQEAKRATALKEGGEEVHDEKGGEHNHHPHLKKSKNHECPGCGKGFTRKGSLHTHMKQRCKELQKEDEGEEG